MDLLLLTLVKTVFMDLLLNSTTIPYIKSTYNIEISNNKYLSYSRLRQLCSFCLGVQLIGVLMLCLWCSYRLLIEYPIIISAELYAYASALFMCITMFLRSQCYAYAMPMIKIRHKKETIKVPYCVGVYCVVLFGV